MKIIVTNNIRESEHFTESRNSFGRMANSYNNNGDDDGDDDDNDQRRVQWL